MCKFVVEHMKYNVMFDEYNYRIIVVSLTTFYNIGEKPWLHY